MSKITFENKENSSIIQTRKLQVTAEDLNEIKIVVNTNDDSMIAHLRAFVKLINSSCNFAGFIGDSFPSNPDENNVYLITVASEDFEIGNLVKKTGSEFVIINTYSIEDLKTYII